MPAVARAPCFAAPHLTLYPAAYPAAYPPAHHPARHPPLVAAPTQLLARDRHHRPRHDRRRLALAVALTLMTEAVGPAPPLLSGLQ